MAPEPEGDETEESPARFQWAMSLKLSWTDRVDCRWAAG